jgi:outer membrane receptor protein involved in Fe transport
MNQNYSLFAGEIEVKEAYGEVGAPILRDLPFVKSLDVNGAVRETDYSTSGSVTTWKIGATWDINDMFRFRITKSHDIRAPNINELFNPGSEGNPQVTNPLNNAQGFIKSNTVGNPGLKPEIGDTITGGVIFRPTWDWAQGFSASVDYWSIHLGNAIATLAVQNVIDGCLKGTDKSLCQYLTLDSSALGIARVNSPNLNLNAQKTDGFDIELNYAVPLERFNVPGQLTIRTLGLYTNNAKTIAGTTELNAVDLAASPRFFTSTLFTYNLGRAKVNLTARYTSPIKYSNTLVGPDDPSYNIAATNSINKNLWKVPVYWNGAFAWDLKTAGSDRTEQVYVNIDNIFDKQPPIVAWQLSGGPYDLVGRSFKLGFRLRY